MWFSRNPSNDHQSPYISFCWDLIISGLGSIGEIIYNHRERSWGLQESPSLECTNVFVGPFGSNGNVGLFSP